MPTVVRSPAAYPDIDGSIPFFSNWDAIPWKRLWHWMGIQPHHGTLSPVHTGSHSPKEGQLCWVAYITGEGLATEGGIQYLENGSFFCGRKSNFICRASKIRVTTQKTKEETLWWFKIISPQNWIVLHKFQTTNSPLKVHLQSLGGRADRAAPCLTSLGTAGYGKPITSPLSIRSIRSISTGFHVDWDTGGHALIFWLTSSVMWPSFGDGSKVNTDDVQDSGDEHDNNTMI